MSDKSIAAPAGLARRAFVTALAGGAAAAIVAPAASLASGEPDPIFAAIDAHNVGLASFDNLIEENYRLEATLPKEVRQSSITIHGKCIVETDAPEWLANERAREAAMEAEADSELKLATIVPTTMAGISALLALAASDQDSMWRELADDDGIARQWEFFVMRNCAEALANLNARSLSRAARSIAVLT
jgi:predicted enzyme involved in methoxymalonyl-ACP biosynthesis